MIILEAEEGWQGLKDVMTANQEPNAHRNYTESGSESESTY